MVVGNINLSQLYCSILFHIYTNTRVTDTCLGKHHIFLTNQIYTNLINVFRYIILTLIILCILCIPTVYEVGYRGAMGCIQMTMTVYRSYVPLDYTKKVKKSKTND